MRQSNAFAETITFETCYKGWTVYKWSYCESCCKHCSTLSSEDVTTNMNCIIRNTDFIRVIKISYWPYHTSPSLNLYTFNGGWLHNHVLQMSETHLIQNVFASQHLYHTMFHNDNLLRSEIIFQLLMTGAVGAVSSELLIRLQKLLQLRPHRTTKCKPCKYLIQSMQLYVVGFYFLPALIMIHSFLALETAKRHHLYPILANLLANKSSNFAYTRATKSLKFRI
jgi:hypothetical protein